MGAGPMRETARRLLPYALGTWLVGVQTIELLAAVGAWGTLLAAVACTEWEKDDAPFTGLVVWLGLSLAFPLLGGHTPTADGLARLSDWVTLAGAALAVRALDAKTLVRVGLGGAAVLALSVAVAALQHLGWWPPLETFAPLGWTKLGFHRVYETVPGRSDRFMAGGLLLHRLKFANVTAALCVLGAAAAARRVPRWPLFAAATALGLAGLSVFPHARAATAAAVVAVAVTWVLAAERRGRATVGALGLGALAVAVVLATPSLRARFASSLSGEGSGERGAITRAGLRAVTQHPLTGVGPGRFRPGPFTLPWDPPQAVEHPGKAHNQLVTLAAESGAAAALALVVLLLGWLARGWRALPHGAALVGGVALFALLGALHDPLFHAEASFALVLLLGAGLGATARPSPGPSARRP